MKRTPSLTRFVSLAACLLLPAVLNGQTLNTAADFSSDRQRHCELEWGDSGARNQRLYDACLDQQRTAYFELRSMQAFYGNRSFYNRFALPYCQRTNTRDGVTDAQLVLFCLQQEIQGYEDIQALLQRNRSQRVRSVVDTALTNTGSWSLAARQAKTLANAKMVRRQQRFY